MKIIEGKEIEYKNWKDLNSKDDYSLETFEFAERWANFMEDNMKKMLVNGNIYGVTPEILFEIKDRSMRNADINGISGYQYSCAVQILVQMWEYGYILSK